MSTSAQSGSRKSDSIFRLVEFPLIDYSEALELQRSIVAARVAGELGENIILLLEHAPVFTLGRRGGLENLTVSEAFLEKSGVPVVHVERGGNITYHGPGQIVGYPIINLRNARLSVVDYVACLEEVMLLTAADWGVAAERNDLNRGIWVGNSKLGSIGISVRKSNAFHGFAFNVNPSLEPFSWINPCGLEGVGVTSLEQELNRPLPMEEVRWQIKLNLAKVLGTKLLPMTETELRKAINS